MLTTIVTFLLLAASCDSTKDGVQHCNDKIRGIIENSCKLMTAAYRQGPETDDNNSLIVKRENNNQTEFRIEFLENESEYKLFVQLFFLCVSFVCHFDDI